MMELKMELRKKKEKRGQVVAWQGSVTTGRARGGGRGLAVCGRGSGPLPGGLREHVSVHTEGSPPPRLPLPGASRGRSSGQRPPSAAASALTRPPVSAGSQRGTAPRVPATCSAAARLCGACGSSADPRGAPRGRGRGTR